MVLLVVLKLVDIQLQPVFLQMLYLQTQINITKPVPGAV